MPPKFKISKKEIKKIGELARLELKENEIKKIQDELSKILEYIEKLKEVNITGIPPTSHSVLLENVLRKDEFGSSNFNPEISKKLIDLAPEKKDSYLKVKKII